MQVEAHALLARLAPGFPLHLPERVDGSAAPGEDQAVIALAHPVDHDREQLIFLGSSHDRSAVHRAVGVHVAVGDDDQFGPQLCQGPGRFRQLDVVADQDADPQPLPQNRGETVAGAERTALRGP